MGLISELRPGRVRGQGDAVTWWKGLECYLTTETKMTGDESVSQDRSQGACRGGDTWGLCVRQGLGLQVL